MHDIYTKFAICPTWCDWLCCVLCSLKPLCMKKAKKRKEKNLHLDKTNCSVYVFSVLCSACSSTEWNIPTTDSFSKRLTITDTAAHRHTLFALRWNTLRKWKHNGHDIWRMDWWKVAFLFLSIICFIHPVPPPPHVTLRFTDSVMHAPSVLSGGKGWRWTGLKQVAGRLHL